MLLPPPDHGISPGSISLPFETCNQSSVNNQLKRSMRQMRGFNAYELTIAGSDEKAAFLANFAGLSKDDMAYEERLSGALDSLLITLMDTIDEAVASYPEEDWPILTTVAARSLKSGLADAMKRLVEKLDAQLAEIRASS